MGLLGLLLSKQCIAIYYISITKTYDKIKAFSDFFLKLAFAAWTANGVNALFVFDPQLSLAHWTFDVSEVLVISDFFPSELKPSLDRIVNLKKLAVFSTSLVDVS
jgi:hypothetical protein